jgi:hypothetical protein
MGKHGRLALALALVGSAGILSSSCGEREAREACEEYLDRLAGCPNIEIDPNACDDVKASERDRYECLAALEDVCDLAAHAEC